MLAPNVIFDLDGTLVDSLPGIAFSAIHALNECGMPAPECHIRPLIGPPIRSILSVLAGDPAAEKLDALEQAFRRSYDSEGWTRTVLYDGARELLTALAASGRRSFLVTNKPQNPTARILDHFGLRRYFTAIVSRDSASPSFPCKAAMLQFVLDRHGLQNSDCVLVGDTEEDCSAGEQAGVPVIIVSHGYGDFPSDTPHTPAALVGSLTELLSSFPMVGV
jgi:phosphoglycolate phosphatase